MNALSDEEMYIVVSKWPEFHKKYIETYGRYSIYATPRSILEFIKNFIGHSSSSSSSFPKLKRKKEEMEDLPISESIREEYSTPQKEAPVKAIPFFTVSELEKYIKNEISNKRIDESDIRNKYKQIYPKRNKNNTKKFEDIIKEIAQYFVESKFQGTFEDFLGYKSEPSSQPSSELKMGSGLKPESIPNIVDLGRVKIMLKKLFYDNILSVKSGPYKASIPSFNQASVSEKFVQIILNLISGKFPSSKELNELSIKEKALFDRLIFLAGIHKKSENNAPHTIEFLKKRYQILHGEIEAGNNNPSIKKELKTIVHSLKDLKVISHKHMKEYLAKL